MTLKARVTKVGWMHIHIKSVSLRFGFDQTKDWLHVFYLYHGKLNKNQITASGAEDVEDRNLIYDHEDEQLVEHNCL